MRKNTGKVSEKSGNFVSPEKWEPCTNFPPETPTTLYSLGCLNCDLVHLFSSLVAKVFFS